MEFQENVPNDVAGPVASKTRLSPSPFLRERGGGGDCLPSAPNFGVLYALSDLLDTFPQKIHRKKQITTSRPSN